MNEKFPFYKESRTERLSEVPEELTFIRRARQNSPAGYRPGKGLVDAVNAALMLGQPLLLTGEAGTGKTQLAHSLNWQIGFKNESPFVFETKSTSTARDLFYSFDTVGRFHAAQTGQGSQKNRNYITYNALGKAMLFANQKPEVEDLLPEKDDFLHSISAGEWQTRSVVLIDEIDKAPRDFPNDILNEIERMFFRITELNNRTVEVTEEKFRPVIVLTSNSEKNLPDAFLRRCVYYNIEFPDVNEMRMIVDERIGDGGQSRVQGDARWYDVLIDLFEKLRKSGQLTKKPATAELLGWITAVNRLLEHYEVSESGNSRQTYLRSANGVKKIVVPTLCVLLKNANDPESAKMIVEEWQKT